MSVQPIPTVKEALAKVIGSSTVNEYVVKQIGEAMMQIERACAIAQSSNKLSAATQPFVKLRKITQELSILMQEVNNMEGL